MVFWWLDRIWPSCHMGAGNSSTILPEKVSPILSKYYSSRPFGWRFESGFSRLYPPLNVIVFCVWGNSNQSHSCYSTPSNVGPNLSKYDPIDIF